MTAGYGRRFGIRNTHGVAITISGICHLATDFIGGNLRDLLVVQRRKHSGIGQETMNETPYEMS